MAPAQAAQKRLTKEYKAIQANPPPYIIAKPNDSNILEWHYVITGPPGTPFEGGQYHGQLRFPMEYPFKPPSISMTTPNGRFACNTRLCLLMSDYHPDTWNPAWSVSTILTGLLSFMTGNETTTGSIQTTDVVKRKLARASKKWNATENVKFFTQFEDLKKSNLKEVKEMEEQETKEQRGEVVIEKPVDLKEKLSTMDPEDRARFESSDDTAGWRVPGLAPIVWVAVAAFAVYLLKM